MCLYQIVYFWSTTRGGVTWSSESCVCNYLSCHNAIIRRLQTDDPVLGICQVLSSQHPPPLWNIEGLLCCSAQVKSFMLQRSCSYSCLLFFPSKKEIMLRPSWSRLPLLKHHETDVSPTENLKVRMILRPPTAGIICSTFAMTNSPWIDVRFHCNF